MSQKIYYWEELFRQRRFVLRRGVDYTCQQGTMSQQIRNAASKYGVSASVVETDEGFTVIVHHPQPTEEPCLGT